MVLKPSDFKSLQKKPNTSTLSIKSGSNRVAFEMARKNLSNTIGVIGLEETIHFFSKAEWSIPDLIDYIAKQFGPCDLRLTSFSFTLPALVHIKNLIEIRQINKVQFLLDKSVTAQKEKFEQIKKLPISLRYVKCHAKVVLLENEKIKIAIISSANLNRNPRWEAGCITTCASVYDFYSKNFNAIWQTAQEKM